MEHIKEPTEGTGSQAPITLPAQAPRRLSLAEWHCPLDGFRNSGDRPRCKKCYIGRRTVTK